MTTDTRKPITLHTLRQMHASGDPIAMVTSYDASFTRVADDAGVDCILVGDSLGMVVQGQTSTVPVTLEEMAYHTRCVARGIRTAWLIADLPFGSYQESVEQAVRSATVLMQAGAQMVKLECLWRLPHPGQRRGARGHVAPPCQGAGRGRRLDGGV